MRRFQTKARIPLCGLILGSFFLPAYAHYNAIQFISLMLAAVNKANEITAADAFVAITALLMIPFSALLLLTRWYLRLPTPKVYLAMPFIFFMFFAGLLFTGLTGQNGSAVSNAFAATGPGFYTAGLSSFLVLFTKTARRKRSRRKKIADIEITT